MRNRNRPTPRRTGRNLGAAILVAAVWLTWIGAKPAVAVEPTPVTVDVMVIYTPGVVSRYGSGTSTRINHLINVTNQIHAASQSGIRIRLVHSQLVAYSDAVHSLTAVEDFTANSGVFAGMEALRSQTGADLAVLMRPYANDLVCGMAWLGGYGTNGDFSSSNRYGYSHVSVDCSDYVLAHELGHNMGLSHSRAQGQPGTYPWALGHGRLFSFVTVMAYSSVFGSAAKLHLFSSPVLSCRGYPCGVSRFDPVNGADAVYTLQTVRGQVAAYQPTVVSPPPPTSPGVEITAPRASDGRLRAGQQVLVQMILDSSVASVDLFFKGSRKKLRRWRPLTTGFRGTQYAFNVPRRLKGQRLTVMAVARDSSGGEINRDISDSVKVAKKSKKKHRRKKKRRR